MEILARSVGPIKKFARDVEKIAYFVIAPYKKNSIFCNCTLTGKIAYFVIAIYRKNSIFCNCTLQEKEQCNENTVLMLNERIERSKKGTNKNFYKYKVFCCFFS